MFLVSRTFGPILNPLATIFPFLCRDEGMVALVGEDRTVV